MLNRVVTEGTAGAAQFDFTNVAGKTGTSTGPKDVWFVGFTGKYVAGVWLGNDDNHPMRAGVTGGHQAAPVWHDLMTVAHTDMNIPTIPGLGSASAPDRGTATPRRAEGGAGCGGNVTRRPRGCRRSPRS